MLGNSIRVLNWGGGGGGGVIHLGCWWDLILTFGINISIDPLRITQNLSQTDSISKELRNLQKSVSNR